MTLNRISMFSRYESNCDPQIKFKLKLICDYLDGKSFNYLTKEYGVDQRHFKTLLNAFETGDVTAFERSRVGYRQKRLIRPLTEAEKRDLECLLYSTAILQTKRICKTILMAQDYNSVKKLADEVGILCSKTLRKYLDRFVKEGVAGLSHRKTGPKTQDQTILD